jgi:hypothetical protein
MASIMMLRRQALGQVLAATGGILALAGQPLRALAQPSDPPVPLDPVGDEALRALFGDRDAAQPLAVAYVVAGSGRRFHIDRSQPDFVLLQFDEGTEVWALRSSFGVRGDEFLRNDVGATMLRITALGGTTLYVDGDTAGVPAAAEGRGRLVARPRSNHRTLQLTVEASLPALQRLLPAGVTFRVEAAGVLPLALVEDALSILTLAISRLPARGARLRQAPLRRVRCVRSRRGTYANFRNGYLELGLVPGTGFAGRPSSLAIRNGLLGTRGIPN